MRHRLMLPAILALLAGCSSPINAENYAKIHTGMSRDEVVGLLGKPTECSGLTLPILAAEKCSWQAGSRLISVNFVNHAAVTASGEGL